MVFSGVSHSTHVDSKIHVIAKNSTNVSTGMFAPGLMAIYCHSKPLLAAQKASPIVKTSENERIWEKVATTTS
jgi:hypothetical protein